LIEEEKKVADSVKVYRVLTYLSTIYNESIAGSCVPVMKTCIESLGVLMLFATIRMYRNVNIWIYILFPVGAVTYVFLAMLVIVLMAGVHEKSSLYLQNFRRELPKKSPA